MRHLNQVTAVGPTLYNNIPDVILKPSKVMKHLNHFTAVGPTLYIPDVIVQSSKVIRDLNQVTAVGSTLYNYIPDETVKPRKVTMLLCFGI